jgi:hypothetical protein
MVEILVWLSLVAACVAVGLAYSRFTPGACCGCIQSVENGCNTYCSGNAAQYYAITFGTVTTYSGGGCTDCAEWDGLTVIFDFDLWLGGCQWRSAGVSSLCGSASIYVTTHPTCLYLNAAHDMTADLELACLTGTSPNEIGFRLTVFRVTRATCLKSSLATYEWYSGEPCDSSINCLSAPVGATMTKTTTDSASGLCNWPSTITMDGPV